MTPNLRIYASEQSARSVYDELGENGFERRKIISPTDAAGNEAGAVTEAIKEGLLPEKFQKLATRNLKAGNYLVCVRATFGWAGDAMTIMRRDDLVDADLMDRYGSRDPSPLSDALGWSPLSSVSPTNSLISNSWTFSKFIGMGLLINKAAPLSSSTGMPLLTKRKKDRKSSFGIPLLSKNPAPLSSLFGMGTLTKPKKKGEWTSSYGMPLLWRKPAPLSSMLGIGTLTEEAKAKKK